ncbi:hypothetical protein OWV82_014552 [Melia azedarach]|uniref:Uncharacterized protein n=1 Tax=Melia azedarach TaxID=155640 RepID=A0ACC1XNH5_MELAZ|nr:hypothetical protein OWV82_014552 [Melia azedarach]
MSGGQMKGRGKGQVGTCERSWGWLIIFVFFYFPSAYAICTTLLPSSHLLLCGFEGKMQSSDRSHCLWMVQLPMIPMVLQHEPFANDVPGSWSLC